MKEKINTSNTESSKRDGGFTRRHFINSILTLSLFAMARPFVESGKGYAESGYSEYLFVNGWLIRNDDYEAMKDVKRS